MDWNSPTPFQLEALHEALLAAFPGYPDFNRLLQFRLGLSYAALVPYGASYQDGLLAILDGERAKGKLDSLVNAAFRERPNNPKLRLLQRTLPVSSLELPLQAGDLQSRVRSDGGYQDLLPWLQCFEDLAHRMCRIEYPRGTDRGTGWLVGADLLITNWHVLRAVLPDGLNKSAADVVCRFGYAVHAGELFAGQEVTLAAHDWLLDSSQPSASELGAEPGAPGADTLDFVVVRLARQVGEEDAGSARKRGWVDLSTSAAWPAAGSVVFVLQHPGGQPLKVAAGDVVGGGSLAGASGAWRLFHSANTEEGSSGSLVVDMALRPVALHHAGAVAGAAQPLNQAVPLSLIAARLRERRLVG